MCGPLILSWRVFHEVCMKPKADFWTPFLLCTHMYTFGITPSPTYDAYIIFLPTNPLHHHLIQNVCKLSFKKLPNIKSIQKLPENNRRNFPVFHTMVTKKIQRVFSNLFVLGWKLFDFVPRTFSAFRNLPRFPALDVLLLDGLGKRLKILMCNKI